MATHKIRRNVAGYSQTAAGASSATVVLSDWTNAYGWVAIVELSVSALGFQTGSSNTYYRRDVFEWTAAAAAPTAVGALVADTVLEQDAAWDSHLALNGNDVEVHCVGDAVETVDWSWSGTVTLQRVI